MKFARCAFGVLKVGKDAPALFIEGPSGGGYADAPRGAIEQPGAQALLELQYMLAGRRARKAEPFGGPGKAAALDDGGKNSRVFKAIHVANLIVNK